MDDGALGLDGEDFALLDEVLGENALRHDGLGLDATHGLMTAIIIGPVALPSDEWMPVVLGNRPLSECHEDPAMNSVLPLLGRLYNATRQAIEQFVFEPVLAHVQVDEQEIDIDSSGWCEGFSIGLDMCSQRWEQQMRSDPALLDLLSPIIMLGVDDGAFPGIAPESDMLPLSDRERDELRQRIPGAVLDTYLYWKDHAGRATPEPPRFAPEDIADEPEEMSMPRGQRLH